MSKNNFYLSWFVGIPNTFANMVLLLHFHTTKVQLFFHIRKKNNNYFSKKCTFLCIFLAVGKSPAFYTLHTRTYNNKNNRSGGHNPHKTTCSTHTTPSTESQHPHTAHDGNTTPTHNNNLNTWTHYTHTTPTQDKENTKQWEHIATWTPEQGDTVHTMDKEKKTQDKEMKTCTDTWTGEDTHKDINNGDSAQRTDWTQCTVDSDIYIKEKKEIYI